MRFHIIAHLTDRGTTLYTIAHRDAQGEMVVADNAPQGTNRNMVAKCLAFYTPNPTPPVPPRCKYGYVPTPHKETSNDK